VSGEVIVTTKEFRRRKWKEKKERYLHDVSVLPLSFVWMIVSTFVRTPQQPLASPVVSLSISFQYRAVGNKKKKV
jgi:hypothetical protein